MKVNFHIAFKNSQGEEAFEWVPAGEKKEKRYQMIDEVLCQGLFDGKYIHMTGRDEDDSRSKLQAFELYLKPRQANGELDITIEEATLIKKVALLLPPGAYGQIYNIIERGN